MESTANLAVRATFLIAVVVLNIFNSYNSFLKLEKKLIERDKMCFIAMETIGSC
jgi:hypothetical protein